MPDAAPIITIEFGEPKYGWLPIIFSAADFRLELHASDVPVNPLEALLEALTVVPAGGNASVLWYLEPAEYWFNFDNQLGVITLNIIERASYNQAPTQLFRFTGSVKELLVPFYKALKQFTAHSYSEAHWPKLTNAKVMRLGQLLQNQF